MSLSADETMPPRPECEFDFNLPHGIDQNGQDFENCQNNDQSTESLLDPSNREGSLSSDDLENAQQPLDYNAFPAGFADDDGGDQALERSWAARQARSLSPESQKSPRRDDDGSIDEAGPTNKRPRRSLFGGLADDIENDDLDMNLKDQSKDIEAPQPLTPGVRHRLSSLNIDQREEQDAEVDRPFDFGLEFVSFDQDNVSRTSSRALSEESMIIPPDNQPVYDLRQGIDRSKAYTYMDTDNTGNYDPAQEAKTTAARLQKAKSAKAAKKKGKSKQKVKEHIPKCIARLRFAAFGNVRNINNDEQSWPVGWSEEDTEYEEEAKDYRDYFRRGTSKHRMQVRIEDPSGVVNDLTGYPAARGCKQCRIDGKDCTMVQGGTYPCSECEDEEVMCEPIVEPTMKGNCKQCFRDGQDNCSFKDDSEQAICEQCTDSQFICEILPPDNYKAPRVSLNEILYGPNRKYVQCTYCREEKKRCSLKKKTDKPPCKSCKNRGIACTFIDRAKAVTERQATAAKKKQEALNVKSNAIGVSKPGHGDFTLEDLADLSSDDDTFVYREETPEEFMTDLDGNRGVLTKISTSFAHPINFNVNVDQRTDCNFCEMPTFGLIGYFERRVHVIKYDSGLGYTEVGGGYCEDKGSTTMCTDCTMSRVQIILCSNHEFERLFDDTDTQDFETVGIELASAEPGSADVHYQLQRWCSLCFSVATWGCATQQPTLSGDIDEDMRVGCGLRLCDRCLESLRDGHLWNLGSLAEVMVRMPKATEAEAEAGELQGTPRADVGYLRENGLLMRCIAAAADGDVETAEWQ